jgi:hypothetical protein
MNNDHLSTTTILNPARAILISILILNNDHLSTTTSGHLNLGGFELKTCLQILEKICKFSKKISVHESNLTTSPI